MPAAPRFRVTRPVIPHAQFCVLFPALLYVACNAVNLGRLAKWFPGPQGSPDWVAVSGYLFAGLCLFILAFTLLAHRYLLKPLAIFLAWSSAAATYFIAKYGAAIDASMIQNTFHTDPTEVGQLLSTQMIPYALGLAVLPTLLVLFVKVEFRSAGRHLLNVLALCTVMLLAAGASLYLNFNAILRAGNVSNKYIIYTLVPIDVIVGTVGVGLDKVRPLIAGARRPVAVNARVAKPGNLVVVLAVGESSRQANFGVYGYRRRDTTPTLGAMDGVVALNGIAKQASTINALPEILEKRGVKLPRLVAHTGIPVACFVNYTLYDNCDGVGETRVTGCGHGGTCYDEDVLPLLDARLKAWRSGYEFVVLHFGGGSHGPLYRDRHPPEFLKFQPTCSDADVANRCTRDELFNSYDNTILYVDHVVGGALRSLDRSGVPYVFIYLSDHGESLMEDGAMFHGVPPGVALPKEQAQIPLLVKASVPLTVDRRDAYGQPDVFDSVLRLFSIEAEGFDLAGGFLGRAQPVP